MLSVQSPLDVQLAVTQQDFEDACNVRARAYGHHDPAMALQFGAVESLDSAGSAVVLLCRDRVDARCLGTARIQLSDSGPLSLEQGICLPPWLRSRPRAQISRLAVLPGASATVKLMLMKACYQYCLAARIRWMVIGARSPGLIRNYRMLGFRDVFEPGAWFALAGVGGLPHQILAFDVANARAAWQAARHRLYAFMTEPCAPDWLAQAANDGWVRSHRMDLIA